MQAFQGPALLAYNNAVFSPRDFKSISCIGDSQKKEEGGKTGRFGIGTQQDRHTWSLYTFIFAVDRWGDGAVSQEQTVPFRCVRDSNVSWVYGLLACIEQALFVVSHHSGSNM